ncbi:MAG: hypothetical protein ACI808_000885 [Paraglaciecola sp.]
MKPASFYAAYIVKKLWALIAVTVVLVAVTLSILRYSVPYMDNQKHHLENWLEERFGVELSIGEITAEWLGAGPAIVLRNVQLAQNSQSPISINIGKTLIEVDFWASVLAGQIRSSTFDLSEMLFTVDMTSLHQEDSDFPIVDALQTLFLQRLQSFSVSNSKVQLITKNDRHMVIIEKLSWVNRDQRHQGVGQLQVEELAKNSVSFTLDMYGGENNLRGDFFAKADEVDLSPWLNQWLNTRYELTESRGSFVVWASILNNKLETVQLDFSESRFKWADADSTINATILGGKINTSPAAKEWLFNFQDIILQVNDQIFESNWLGIIDIDGNLSIQPEHALQIDEILPLLPLILEPQTYALLEQLRPQAIADELNLQFTLDGKTYAHAALSDIGWQQTDFLPGAENLTAVLNWYDDKGQIRLLGNDSQLMIDRMLSDNLGYQQISANVYIESAEQGVIITAPDISFSSDWLNIKQSFNYRSADNYLTLTGNVDALDVTQLEYLYPAEVIGQKTTDYLLSGLVDGEVKSAQFLLQGVINAFPFRKQQGIFQVAVDLHQTHLIFDPQWPAVTNMDATLLFENEALHILAQRGELLDIGLSAVQATIPDLAHNAVLLIDAQASASGPQVTELMLQSSIADSLGTALQQVVISEQVNVDLHLNIPLSGENIVASGTATLVENGIYIPSLDLQFDQAQGDVSFVNDKVEFSGLTANLLDQAVTIAFNGHAEQTNYFSNISLNGDWEIGPLLEKYHPATNNYLSGTSKWQADVQLTIPEDGFEYSAVITSALVGIQSKLPSPFAKKAEQVLAMQLTSSGDKQASTVSIKLGDDVKFNGNLPHQDMQFSRAHLNIGESDSAGMGLGFSIAVNMPVIDSTEWYKTISTLLVDLPEGDTPLISAPQRIFVNADSALVASQKFTDVELVAKNNSDNWTLDLNAKQARAKVTLHKDWLKEGIDISADFIDLADWHGEQSSLLAIQQEPDGKNSEPLLVAEKPLFSPDPATFPPVKFVCLRCRYQDNDLGRVDFSLSRAANGMHIDNLRLNNTNGIFNATGDWFLSEHSSSTHLKGNISSSDFGALLKGFQFDSGIKDSKATADFDLSWQRAPYEFNFDSLNGDITWRLSDGYLTDVPDKGSRLFTILSLESLVRKLKLDFRDVFAKGFFYDKIKGSFQLSDGTADTRDTIVDGGAGEITMHGYTNLNSKELNYQIAFAPKVTSSLPVIIAYMVNPATALAALALDQVLTSAKVISNIKFSLTGTLDDPKLEELGRDSKDITLPAQIDPNKELSTPPIDGDTSSEFPSNDNAMQVEVHSD